MDPRQQQLQPLQAERVMASCCGRNVLVSLAATQQVSAMQAELQRELQMHGQAFEIFDVHGTNLPTDKDLVNAVASKRTPLVCTLSDGTIHYIENRREELSQMQWKVVRDQLNGLSEKILQLGRHVQEINIAVNMHKRESETAHERLRHELFGLVDDAKDMARQQFAESLERGDAFSHLIHTERNLREASIQGIERQIQGTRDAIDLDRASRRQDALSSASLLEQYHQELLQEVKGREALEDRHKIDVHRLTERIEVLPRLQAEPVHELGEEIKKAQLKFFTDFEEQSRALMLVKSIAETVQYETSVRYQEMEKRCQSYDQRIDMCSRRQGTQFDELRHRTEKLAANAEQSKLEERGKSLATALQGALARVEETGAAARYERPFEPVAVQTMQAERGGSCAVPSGSVCAVSGGSCSVRATPQQPTRAISAEPAGSFRRAMVLNAPQMPQMQQMAMSPRLHAPQACAQFGPMTMR